MKFTFHKLGAVDQAEIEINKLTIISGKNNTGKTYLTYTLYGFLKTWSHFFDAGLTQNDYATLREIGRVDIDIKKLYHENHRKHAISAIDNYTKKLGTVFSSQDEKFSETNIDLTFNITDDYFRSSFTREFRSEKGKNVISFKRDADSSFMQVSYVVTDDLRSDSVPKSLIKDIINEAAWGKIFPRPFIISTERTGAVMFRGELNIAKNRLIEYAQKLKAGDEYSPISLIESMFETGYPLPVSDNVEYINSLSRIDKNKSQISIDHPDIIKFLDEITGGQYKTSKDGDIHFIPKKGKQKLKMSESSSSVRSLVLLSHYLKHTAMVGDALIIDEPELNLHPSSQIKVARLIARLVNAGIKVILTTHSDYVVKEINTLIMLNSAKFTKEEICKKYGYHQEELISPDDVSLFMLNEKGYYTPKAGGKRVRGTVLEKAPLDRDYGFDAPVFDEIINKMNEIQEEIAMSVVLG